MGINRIRGWNKMSKKAKEAFSRNSRRVKVVAKECGIKRGMSREALKRAMKNCVKPAFKKRGGYAHHINGY